MERLNLMSKKVAELEATNEQVLSEKDLKTYIDQLKLAKTQASVKAKSKRKQFRKVFKIRLTN